MNRELQKLIQGMNEEQKSLWESYIKDTDLDVKKLEIYDTVSGQLDSWCRPPRRRPLWTGWREFSLTTVINDGDDWTIFGTIKNMDNGIQSSFTVDLLKSQNLFEVRIGTNYPWRASLSETNAVSYRTSSNQIVIRAIDVKSTGASYCSLIGMIAAEKSNLKSIEVESIST
jgi:hypothetical protein